MQFLIIAVLSILWKLAVLPVVVGLVARVLRVWLGKRARRRSPHAWRIDARVRAADPARSRLWHLRGMGVLVLDAEALYWTQLWPREELRLPMEQIREAFAVGVGAGGLLRIEDDAGEVHLWRVPDADAWAGELRGRRAV